MDGLKVFNYEGNEVRTVIKGGEPWWVLKDVCAVLGLSNSRMIAERLDEDEKGVSRIYTPGGNQQMTVVNESGLYSVILRSDKPNARPFRKWVTSEVLPSIRRHGGYLTPAKLEEALADPDTLIRLATALKEERRRRLEAESEKAELSAQLDESREWYTVKRVAKMNGLDWRGLDWKALKRASKAMGLGVKKIFDANYGKVNAYHVGAWRHEYAHLRY